MDSRLQELIDRQEIRDVVARYARAVDRLDLEGVRETYHPDAYDDHGDYKGGVDGFIEFVQKRTGGAPQVMHFLGQTLVEFASSDVAIAETYFMTAHTLGPAAQKEYGTSGGGPVQISLYGRYVDRMERRGGPWKVARRTVVFEAARTFAGDAPPLKPEWAQQRRDKDDPIFRARAEAGL